MVSGASPRTSSVVNVSKETRDRVLAASRPRTALANPCHLRSTRIEMSSCVRCIAQRFVRHDRPEAESSIPKPREPLELHFGLLRRWTIPSARFFGELNERLDSLIRDAGFRLVEKDPVDPPASSACHAQGQKRIAAGNEAHRNDSGDSSCRPCGKRRSVPANATASIVVLLFVRLWNGRECVAREERLLQHPPKGEILP
jgi:hypothetical protein